MYVCLVGLLVDLLLLCRFGGKDTHIADSGVCVLVSLSVHVSMRITACKYVCGHVHILCETEQMFCLTDIRGEGLRCDEVGVHHLCWH